MWAIIILSTVAFKFFDSYYYEKDEEWKRYKEFNVARAELLDAEIPEYNENVEEYTALGISENDLTMYSNWTFADPDLFTVDTVKGILKIKENTISKKELIGVFFKEIIPGTMGETFFQATLILFIIWILFSRKKLWAILYEIVTFGVVNCCFIFIQRYLIKRVDFVVAFSIFMVIAFCLKEINMRTEKNIQMAVLLIAFIANLNIYKANIFDYDKDIKQRNREIIDTFSEQKEKCYISTVYSSKIAQAYDLFSNVEKGKLDNQFLLGGWETYMPTHNNIQNYGIHNPFRDIINNSNAYLVDDGGMVNVIVQYIREHYYNVDVIPVSQVGNLIIYRVVGE